MLCESDGGGEVSVLLVSGSAGEVLALSGLLLCVLLQSDVCVLSLLLRVGASLVCE